MLNKLIKYDIKSTWRDFAGIYMSIILGVILVPLLINNVNNQFINMAAGFVAFAIIVAVIVILITNLFKIYNVNVFSKEGYLTMTLPVSPVQIVTSKLLVSSMWIILTGVVSVIGLFIFAMIISPISFSEITDAIQQAFALLNSKGMFTIVLLILTFILSSIKEVAKLFLACSIAHLRQLNRFRVPVGILSYFAFSWVEALIIQIIGKVLVNVSTNGNELMIQLEAMSNCSDIEQFTGLFYGVIAFGIVYSLILILAYSFGNVWILKHKLDLH